MRKPHKNSEAPSVSRNTPDPTSLAGFEAELGRLVEQFDRNLQQYKSVAYDEASLRQEFLNPFFRSLGWDTENKAGLIPRHRDVEIESRAMAAGRHERADYLFRTYPTDRFVCEAKKPSQPLHADYAFQAKRYAWNRNLPLAVLTDFEELKVFIVGGVPSRDEPDAGLWRSWHFRQYAEAAREIWDLLSRPRVAAGAIDQLMASLPKRPARGAKDGRRWIVRPDRSRSLDAVFLNFLDAARRELASDLLRHNDRADLLEGDRLNEAVHRILDRILFLRICDDRGIDTGRPLDLIVRDWRATQEAGEAERPWQRPGTVSEPPAHYGVSGVRAPRGTLWFALVRHFRAMDRRPPSHIPFFNGNLFKPHFSEELVVGDDWLAGFLGRIGGETSDYMFRYIAVEILGTIYERFLGKIVRPKGRGVAIEEKPEVRKAGGVYYTPRYVVEYIVAQTVGKRLEGRTPEEALEVRILDPACGSGSFLIRAFEAVCEHCQQWFTDHPTRRKRDWCWVDESDDSVHLTTRAKRRILRQTIHGVDLDPQAVEVTQLSLYLKMLEGEDRATLARERDLFGNGEPLLPSLDANVKCGNSLVASDFSVMPEDLVRVRAFDWDVQFPEIMKGGGFDAVIGNPPYVRQESLKDFKAYFAKTYRAFAATGDLYIYFMERGVRLLRPDGRYGVIVSSSLLRATYAAALRSTLRELASVHRIVDFGGLAVFADAKDTYVCIPVLVRGAQSRRIEIGKVRSLDADRVQSEMERTEFLISADELRREGWVLRSGKEVSLLKKLMRMGEPMGRYIGGKMFYGLKTGFNEAFVVDTQRRDAFVGECRACAKVLHACRGGEEVRAYDIEPSDRWLLVLPAGWTRHAMGMASPHVSEEKAWAWLEREIPPIAAHLKAFRKSLQTRQDQGDYWWELRPCDYYQVFAQPKIVFPDICKFPRFSLDESGLYLTNTAYALGTGDKCLLGILNSRLFWFAIGQISIPFGVRAGEFRYRLIYQYMEKVPIRRLDPSLSTDRVRHERIVGLVEKRLALTPRLRTAKTDAERATLQNAVQAADRQIDALVYELYDLTPEEIRVVEGVA